MCGEPFARAKFLAPVPTASCRAFDPDGHPPGPDAELVRRDKTPEKSPAGKLPQGDIRVVLPQLSATHPELLLITSMFHHY